MPASDNSDGGHDGNCAQKRIFYVEWVVKRLGRFTFIDAHANGGSAVESAMPRRPDNSIWASHFACRGARTSEGLRKMQNDVLADYIPLNEVARQPGMPTLQTLKRMAKQGKLPVVPFGKRLLLDVPRFRELLRAGTIKVNA
jgi:hypothetical protein